MKKIAKKSVINQQFLIFLFSVCSFLSILAVFLTKQANFQQKRSRSIANGRFDYEKIGESAMDSMDDMRRIQIQQMKAACNF